MVKKLIEVKLCRMCNIKNSNGADGLCNVCRSLRRTKNIITKKRV